MEAFEPNRKDIEYVLSCSYGKDSLACIGACELLGWRIDRIIHAEVWATDSISAEMPKMQEFKSKADKIIKERYGIEVEHYRSNATYESQFYSLRFNKKLQKKIIYGFPMQKGAWCNSKLKMEAIRKAKKSKKSNTVSFIGIATDEPKRLQRLNGVDEISPLNAIGWTEADAKQWCIDNGLLSPIYTESTRGGCWFCHNQSIEQLRKLRTNYPQLWELLLKWDNDSEVTFKANGHTVHDFEKRFQAEQDGYELNNFRWKDLEHLQTNIYQMFDNDGNYIYRE